MKMPILCLSLLAIALLFPVTASAAEEGTYTSPQAQAFASLTPDQKTKVLKARDTVFQTHPELKAEQDELAEQFKTSQTSGQISKKDRHDFFKKFSAHQKKLHAAMLQVDPTLQPIFDQLEQKAKANWQQYQNTSAKP